MTAPRHDTWIPIYVGAYLRDTSRLNTAQHGAYLLFMLEAWTHDGLIPDDDRALAQIARLQLREWRAMKSAVLSYWRAVEGGYRQKRLDEELDRAKQLVAKKSDAGKASAAARKRQRTLNTCSTDEVTRGSTESQQTGRPLPLPSFPTEKSNARQARLPDALVNQIWESAPAKARERSSKADVRRTLTAAIKRGADPATVAASLLAYYRSEDASKDDGAFAKGIHRMIEGDRWKDWSPAAAVSAKPAEIDWPARLEGWTRERFWIPTMWGADPSSDLCRAPIELLTPEVRRPRMGAR